MPGPTDLALSDQIDALARAAVDRQYARQEGVWTAFSQAGYQKSLRDAGYHFSYLVQALAADDISLFLDYVNWVKVLFHGLHFAPDALAVTLECMDEVVQEKLPPDQALAAHACIDAALQHLEQAPETPQSFLSPASPQHDLAVRYLDSLLRGDRQSASRLILEAAAGGTGVKEIYLNVFQPCQQEVGRLWQLNQISVAQEHFCTVATQMVMSQLYPYIFATPKNGYRLVATAVGEELHEIGMRMVADFLEMEGWDTYYLGANTPTESILRALQERRAHILAVSATISFNIHKVAELIGRVRAAALEPPVKIMVGGYPFNVSRELWKQVGADGYAPNAREAVAAAYRLVGGT